MKNKEFCIMPDNPPKWRNFRFNGSHRHECLFGKNRQKSIEDGLVVFLTQEQHEGTYGVHGRLGHEFDLELKRVAQKTWCDYYNKTTDEFIRRYGRSYL